MSRFYSHLKNAAQILKEYRAEEPFAFFLKKYFSRNKKHGSKDRKEISQLCYCYFRAGKALLDISIEERLLCGLFLCSDRPNEILEQLKPEWNTDIRLPVKEKLLIVNHSSQFGSGTALMGNVFPWKEELSKGIDYAKLSESFFIQPDLFIRLRPGYENEVKTKLMRLQITFLEVTATCLSLPNASKIEKVIDLDREAVVQDLNSQQTGKLLINFKSEISNQEPKVWDCCAASGGKSLLLYDINPNIELTVSDIRESILFNLNKRFAKAGLKNYKSFVIDLTDSNLESQTSQKGSIGKNFDLIVCDAPCTGSGTWSRTPEQLYFFDDKEDRGVFCNSEKNCFNHYPPVKTRWMVIVYNMFGFQKRK